MRRQLRQRRRGRQKKQRRKSILRRIVLLLLLAMGILTGIEFALEHVQAFVEPSLSKMIAYEAGAATTSTINQAVAEALTQDPTLCENLYTIQYAENGALQSVSADPAAMNRAKLQLVTAVESALRDMPPRSRMVPLGSLSDLQFLSNLGPSWELWFQPRAYAEGEIEESVNVVGINQTEYHAELVLNVTVDLILDGRNDTMPVTDRVLLASVVARGDVPTYYSKNS